MMVVAEVSSVAALGTINWWGVVVVVTLQLQGEPIPAM